jgi:hypothetical protein
MFAKDVFYCFLLFGKDQKRLLLSPPRFQGENSKLKKYCRAISQILKG